MFNLTPWKKQSHELAPSEVHPLHRLRNEFDALFERYFGGLPDVFRAGDRLQNFWGLDISEKDNEVVVRADAPGFEPGDFDVRVTGNVLTIRAEQKQEAKKEKQAYSFSERRLERTVTLPAGTNPDQVEARYHNGVLELRLPRTEESRGRRIDVKTS
jgi:HSP20 family protein